jgi:hypothetical protein
MDLDDNLKQLMNRLGIAINESLSESESVSDAINNIRQAGFDVFLMLEATIGFHRREDSQPAERGPALPSGELVLNAQDAQFLKSLKIRLGGADEPPSP